MMGRHFLALMSLLAAASCSVNPPGEPPSPSIPPDNAEFVYDAANFWIYGFQGRLYRLNKKTGESGSSRMTNCSSATVNCVAAGYLGVALSRSSSQGEFDHKNQGYKSTCLDSPQCTLIFTSSYGVDEETGRGEGIYYLSEKMRGIVRLGFILEDQSSRNVVAADGDYVLIRGTGLLAQ